METSTKVVIRKVLSEANRHGLHVCDRAKRQIIRGLIISQRQEDIDFWKKWAAEDHVLHTLGASDDL